MLFSTPEQFVVLAIILVAGYLLGYASAPSARKWKRKLRDQAESFTAYHADAEDRVRAAKERAAALEAEAKALRADREDAERTILAVKPAAPIAVAPAPLSLVENHAPAPSPEPVAEVPHEAEVEAETADEPAVEADAPHSSELPGIEAHEPEVIESIQPAEPVVEPIVAEHDATHAEAAAPAAQSAAHAEFEPDPEQKPAIEHVEPVVPISQAVTQFPMTPTATDAPPAPIGPAEPEMPTKGWFGNSTRDDLTRIRSIDSALNTRLFGMGVLRFEDLEKLSAEDEMALEERLTLPAGFIAREQWRSQAALLRVGIDGEHAERFGTVAPAVIA